MDITDKIDELIADIKKCVDKRISNYANKEISKYEKYRKNILKYAEEPIERIGLSHRTYRILNEKGIRKVGEIILLTEGELYKPGRGLGGKSVNEIKGVLAKRGLKLIDQIKKY